MKFKNLILFLIFLLFSATNPLCAQQNSKSNILILAKIDNEIITSTDLMDRYRFFLLISKIKISSYSEKLLILNQLLQKMIDEELQLNEAENMKLTVEDDQLNKAIESIMHDQDFDNIEKFKNFFTKNNLSYENYIKQLKSQILWSRIVNKTLASKVKISDFEIKEAMEFAKINTDEQKLLLAEIYIPLTSKTQNYKAEELATKLAKEIRIKNNFKNIVKQFSMGQTENDGEIGWIGKNDFNIQVFKIIEQLKIGEISDPILIKDGYHIFKILDKKTINTIKDEDINQVKNEILNKRLQLMAKSYLMDLRKNSFVEIYQDNLKSLL